MHTVLSRRCSQNFREGLWISWKSMHFCPYCWHCLIWVKFILKGQNIVLGIRELDENCGSKSHTFLWASVLWHIRAYYLYVMVHILCSLMLSEEPYQWPAMSVHPPMSAANISVIHFCETLYEHLATVGNLIHWL